MVPEKTEGYKEIREQEKFVVFTIGKQPFAMNILEVNEIIQPVNVTPIPRSHPFIKGVTDIRGEVLAVIDLAKALQLEGKTDNNKARWIVAEIGERKVIFHVSEVEQIIQVAESEIEKPTEMSDRVGEYVTNIIKLPDHIILLLDYPKLLSEIK